MADVCLGVTVTSLYTLVGMGAYHRVYVKGRINLRPFDFGPRVDARSLRISIAKGLRASRRPLNSAANWWVLLGGLLARRIERAGGVNFSDLVIGEAEHLTEDFIGVFAEQRANGSLRSGYPTF